MADGIPITDVAATVGISRRFVYKWVQRFLERGMEGLADQPRPGYHRAPRPAALAASHAVSA
jgi:transposase